MAQTTDPTWPGHAPDGVPLGQRIKRLRKERKLTQRELAARTYGAVAVDVLQSYEQGRRRPTLSRLQAIAYALDVEPGDLLDKPRTLGGDAGEGSGAVAIRHALTAVDILDPDPELEPLTVDAGRRDLVRAWGMYWGGDFPGLGQLIPASLDRVRALVHAAPPTDRPAAADVAAQTFQVAGSVLAHLGFTDAAHGAMNQALRYAVDVEDPLRAQALRSSIAWLYLIEGRWSDSARLAEYVADQVNPTDSAPIGHRALFGSALLSAATAHGRADDRAAAVPLLNHADRVAAQLPGQVNAYEVHFGPDQALMQRVDVLTVTGQWSAAVKAAARMPRDSALPLAARARHGSDVALCLAEMGRDDQAVDRLDAVATMAPSWVRFQAQPQAVYDLLDQRASRRPRRLAQLGEKLGRVA